MSENEKLERKNVSAETCLGCASVHAGDKRCGHTLTYQTPHPGRPRYNVFAYSKDAFNEPISVTRTEGMAADAPGQCPLYRRAGA